MKINEALTKVENIFEVKLKKYGNGSPKGSLWTATCKAKTGKIFECRVFSDASNKNLSFVCLNERYTNSHQKFKSLEELQTYLIFKKTFLQFN